MAPLASSIIPALAHRPRNTYDNSTVISSTLAKAFQPPILKRASVLPARKKRKTTSYAEDAENNGRSDQAYGSDRPRVALGGLDINALKARRRDSGEIFRKSFSIPAKDAEKRIGSAPSLGMLRPANFVPRPLHDPCGEFAIVLYDPTIDDEPPPKIRESITHISGTNTVIEDQPEDKVVEKMEKKMKVHKSLAEILGIQKKTEPTEQPKVAVVIDPKIARILRPHQIEGVKVISLKSR
jgi:DNA repair and recombination protein RAD54 and RAD54-like protein